jgi:hypothetical protein
VLHQRVRKSITGGMNFREQLKCISCICPGVDLLDFIWEVGRLMFRYHLEVRGLNDRCFAIVSSDKVMGG